MSYTRLLHPKYYPAWLGLGILWLITRLPYRWQLAIGTFLGKFLFLFPTKLKNITEKNIALCFPTLSQKERTLLAKKNFANLGIGLIEAAIAWWLPDAKLNCLFTLHGYEKAEAALAKGKGVILLGPHFTSLEIIGRLLGMKYAFAVMYRPHKKALISFIHERFRKKNSIRYIPRQHVRQLLRALQDNMAIWYAYDVDGGKKRSVFAPFFNIQTASLTAVSRIVELSGASVIPISFYRRDSELGYDIFLGEALTDFPSGDLTKDATRLNALLEDAICNKPEQYVWQYKRFKTRPPGEARLY